MKENRKSFLGAYFDKDAILKISRWAGILAWVILGVYIFTSGVTIIQFLQQLFTGIYYQKGMSIFDFMSFFTPYLLQPLPGVVYFFGLKFVQHTLLIFLEVEENTRNSAQSNK